ncbi:hypothetical protein KVM79_04250 [Helicobacter pylori]|nr:hypothetical protein KVM79_04250 [Helicobacter pylori]
MLDTVKDTFGNLLQLLTNLKNKEIEFDFHKKIKKAPMKKFHFRHQKIIHQFFHMDYLARLKEK